MSNAASQAIVKTMGVVAFVIAVVLVLAWTNAFHFQSAGGTSGGAPSDSPTVSLAGGPGGVSGIITARPVCAVEQATPDPSCAPIPVADAVVIAKDAIGDEVGRTTSAADGSYRLPIGLLGPVMISVLPVAGLASPPAPVSVTFPNQMDWEQFNFEYGSGIR